MYSCVLNTIDGGETWQLAYGVGGYDYDGLHYCDSMHGGIYVNTSWSHYTIFTSDNFNSTYFKSFGSLPTELSALYFQNDSTIWVGGSHDGVILRSTDGGINFVTVNPAGIESDHLFVNGFDFWGNTGYAYGLPMFKYIDTLYASVQQIPVAISNLFLYPNPADDKVSIDFTFNQTEKIALELYSPEGRCVYSRT